MKQQRAELKKRMKSVSDIKKITRAMHLVSAVKTRRARQQLEKTLPFFALCAETMIELLESDVRLDNRYFRLRQKEKGEIWKIGYFVLTGDQGLAGAYNQNVIETTETHIHGKIIDNADKGLDTSIKLYVAGKIGKDRLRQNGFEVVSDFKYPISEPTYYRARDIAEFILELYDANVLDLVYFIYTRMESAVTTRPMVTRVLPVNPQALSELIPAEYCKNRGIEAGANVMYTPSAEEVMQYLIHTYLNGMVYGVLTEAYASEQTARMTAMENATENADDMLAKLQLQRNQIRQSRITRELIEIVGGADFLKEGEEK